VRRAALRFKNKTKSAEEEKAKKSLGVGVKEQNGGTR
jgi:hypothetical protein